MLELHIGSQVDTSLPMLVGCASFMYMPICVLRAPHDHCDSVSPDATDNVIMVGVGCKLDPLRDLHCTKLCKYMQYLLR